METTIDPALRSEVGYYLDLTRDIAAPRPLVFRMWSNPHHLSRWCGPRDFTVPLCEGDFRPGGEWRTVLRAADGTEHRLAGRYLAIEPDQRIEQTIPGSMRQAAQGRKPGLPLPWKTSPEAPACISVRARSTTARSATGMVRVGAKHWIGSSTMSPTTEALCPTPSRLSGSVATSGRRGNASGRLSQTRTISATGGVRPDFRQPPRSMV